MAGSLCLSDTERLVQVYEGCHCELGKNPDVCVSKYYKTLKQPVKMRDHVLVANRNFKRGDILWVEPYWEDTGVVFDDMGMVIPQLSYTWSMVSKIVTSKLVMPFLSHLRGNKEFAKHVLSTGNDKMFLQCCARQHNLTNVLDIFTKIVTSCFVYMAQDSTPRVQVSFLSSVCSHNPTPNAVTCIAELSSGNLSELFDTTINHGAKCFAGQAICDISKGEEITVSFGAEYSSFLAHQQCRDVQTFLEGVTKDLLIHGKAIHKVQNHAFPDHKSLCVMLFEGIPTGPPRDCVMRIIKVDDNLFSDPCFLESQDATTKQNIEKLLTQKGIDIVSFIVLFHNEFRYKRTTGFSLDSCEKVKHETPNFINAIGNMCGVPSRLGLGFICGYCNKRETGAKFKRCGLCQARLYCSKECQKLDWKTHKKLCSNRTASINKGCSSRVHEWNVSMNGINIFRS